MRISARSGIPGPGCPPHGMGSLGKSSNKGDNNNGDNDDILPCEGCEVLARVTQPKTCQDSMILSMKIMIIT